MSLFFRKGTTKVGDTELSQLLGYIIATSSNDWSLILELCDRIWASEIATKTVCDGLRKEFLYADPPAQLAAARLWGIILNQPPQDYFLAESTTKRFLDAVEKTIGASHADRLGSPVVRERLLAVLAGASAQYGDDYPRLRLLWAKLKNSDDPVLGIPFEDDDPTFFDVPSMSKSDLSLNERKRHQGTIATLTRRRRKVTTDALPKRPQGTDAKFPNLIEDTKLIPTKSPGRKENEEHFTFLNFDEVLRLSDVGLSESDEFRVTPQHGTFIFTTHTRTILYKADSRKVRQIMYDRHEAGLDYSCNAVLSPDGNILVRRRSTVAPTEAFDLKSKEIIAILDAESSGDKRDLRRSTWASNSTIYIPVQRKGVIMKWSLGGSASTHVFQPLPSLTRHSIIEFCYSRDENWWVVSGRSLSDDQWQGNLQVYDVRSDESSVKNGTVALIVEANVYDRTKQLLVIADSKPGNKLSVVVNELHTDEEDGGFEPVQSNVDLYAERDSPVQIFAFSPLPIIAVATHRNSLYFFELHTGTLLHSHHGLNLIHRSSIDGQSIIHQRRDNSFQRISINEKDLIGWVRRVVKDDTLASGIAIRTGLSGADDVLVNDMHGCYDSLTNDFSP